VATAPSLISMRELERYLEQRMLFIRLGEGTDDACGLSMTLMRRTLTFWLFLVCYGGFLICNVSKYEFEHFVFVSLFALAFFVHAVLRVYDTQAWTGIVSTSGRSAGTLSAVIVTLGFLFFSAMVLIQLGLHADEPPGWLEGFKDAGGFYYIEVGPLSGDSVGQADARLELALCGRH